MEQLFIFLAEPGEILPQSYSGGTFVDADPRAQGKRASPCWYMKTLSGNLCPLAQAVMHEHLMLFWITLLPTFSFFCFLCRVEWTAGVIAFCVAAIKQMNTVRLVSLFKENKKRKYNFHVKFS